MGRLSVLLLLLLLSPLVVDTVLCSSSAAADDLITTLPGMPADYKSKLYSGYVTVDEAHGRNLFYFFAESQRDPANDPLVLWLNGGPGCSSLMGSFSENGPFWAGKDGQSLTSNPYSWNREANMVFLESPAGVGFSYSENTADYTVGDKRTADDSLAFLQGFFEKFPHMRSRDFWVTGESYGGHYVPGLAERIVEYNSQPGVMEKINLKGFMVGNAWTVAAEDNKGAVEFWFGHAMIANSTFQGIMDNCDFDNIGPLRVNAGADHCDNYLNQAAAQSGDITIYDVYQDVCLNSETDATRLVRTLKGTGSAVGAIDISKVPNTNNPADPCIDNWNTIYFNRADVQIALHAKVGTEWAICSNIVNYSRQDLLSSMLPTYNKLIKAGVKILVFSGDVDGIVPFTGTRNWLGVLNRQVKEDQRPWYVDNQVGGYITEYDGLTFSTVRDAGHMVAGTQPARGYYMFSKFLNGEKF